MGESIDIRDWFTHEVPPLPEKYAKALNALVLAFAHKAQIDADELLALILAAHAEKSIGLGVLAVLELLG